MKKIFLALLFVLLASSANAQQVIQLCVPSTSGGITTCQPISSSNPLSITGTLSSGVYLGTSLTATNPQISGDATSGFYTPAGSTIGVVTNGVERMRWTNGSSVGIGTNSPINPLDLYGGMAIGTSYAGINPVPLNGAIIQGSVGIGTNSPLTVLDVRGATDITGSLNTLLSVGTNGTTNPAFAVTIGTSGAVTGLTYTSLATGGIATLTFSDPNTANANANVYTSGAGTANFGTSGSGTAALATNGSERVAATNTKVTIGPPFQAGGTKFTLSACSATVLTGGSFAGNFTCGVSTTCTQVITMNGASGSTASNGFTCFANDETTPANKFSTSAHSTTTATITGTCVTNDIISFACVGY